MADREMETIVESPQLLSRADRERVAAFWTDRRMAEAEPLPLPVLEGEPPEMRAVDREAEMVVETARPPGELAEEDEKTSCFTTSRVSNMKTWPYQVVGKMFMTIGGQNFVGSAWTIYESSVFTAGHCVFDDGKWATNVLFYPQYDNGSTIGSWVASRLVSLKGWTQNRDFQYDLAAFITTSPVRPKTGSLGWIANSSPSLGSPFTAVGYPAQPISGYNFDGRHMWQSVGDYQSGTSILKMCNNMTGGCSGGPWSIVYNGANAYGKGVNSHRYSSEPERLYSPAFQQGFLNITAWLKANGGN